MFIDMKQLFEVEGQVIPFTHDLDMSAIELWGTAPFDRPIRLSGRLYNRAGIVFMEYTAQMDYNLMCGRCLERQRRAEVYRFKHVLVRQLNEEDSVRQSAGFGWSGDIRHSSGTAFCGVLPGGLQGPVSCMRRQLKRKRLRM